MPCAVCARAGHRVVVVDNLAQGHRGGRADRCPVVRARSATHGTLEEVLASERIDSVMHFAALAAVGESVAEPLRYYSNNVVGTLSLLDAMRRPKAFARSSSAPPAR